MLVELVDHIDLNHAYEHLQSPDAGGINVFIGTVRNHSQGKAVLKLVFEAYTPMALTEMTKIAQRARQQWTLHELVILHALGERQVGDLVVVVGAAAAHREASFAACRFLIDELKRSVPIWKKEYYVDNSIWVNAHP